MFFDHWFTSSRASARAPERKASGASLIALQLGGQAQWTPRDYASLAREGVMANPIAYRCVRMIAEGAASVPWLLYEGAHELENHALLDLLNFPNREESGPELFTAWYGHLQTSGNAYLEAVSLRSEVRELHALRPDRMKVVGDARGLTDAYDYTVEGRVLRIIRDANGFLPVLHANRRSQHRHPPADRMRLGSRGFELFRVLPEMESRN